MCIVVGVIIGMFDFFYFYEISGKENFVQEKKGCQGISDFELVF